MRCHQAKTSASSCGIRRLPAHSISSRTRRQSGRGGSGRSAARLVGRSGLATDRGPHRLHRGRQRPAGRGALPGVHLARGPQGRHRRAAPRHPRGRRGCRHRRPRRAGRVLPGIYHEARRRPSRQPGDDPGREEGGRRCQHRRGRGRPDDRLPGQRRPQHASIVYSKPRAPGIWQPPASGMALPWLGFVKPVVDVPPVALDGPDPLTSAAYADDYDEVRRVGAVDSPVTERNDEADRDRPVLLGQPGLDLPHGVVRPARP